MLLSVVIPTKNEEKNLERLLKELDRQSFTDKEVIVADARSTDRTRKVALEYGARVVEGGMPGVGRNAGAAVARAPQLLFLDADAILGHKHFLRDLLKEAHARRLDVLGVPVVPWEGNVGDRIFYGFYNAYARVLEQRLPHAVGTCIYAKRFVHDAIGGFDETVTLGEDMHYVRLGSQVGKFGILKGIRVYTPMRRWRKEGRLRLLWKFLHGEWHMLFHGPIRGAIPYDFIYSSSGDDAVAPPDSRRDG